MASEQELPDAEAKWKFCCREDVHIRYRNHGYEVQVFGGPGAWRHDLDSAVTRVMEMEREKKHVSRNF